MKREPPIHYQAHILREQARCVQQEYPQLFKYMAQRNEATMVLFQEVIRRLPHPDDLPVINQPLMEAIYELIQPEVDCRICKPSTPFWLLSREVQAKLCQICKFGIYLKNSGMAALAG